MDCPRCGAALSAYRLSEREASVCEACGYVGVATDHGGEPREVESWDAAISRARRRLIDGGSDGDGEGSGDAGTGDGEADSDGADGDPAERGDGAADDGTAGNANADGRRDRGSDAVRENGAESGD